MKRKFAGMTEIFAGRDGQWDDDGGGANDAEDFAGDMCYAVVKDIYSWSAGRLEMDSDGTVLVALAPED